MSYKPKVKSAPKKELYFVIWPDPSTEFAAHACESYEDAKELAERCLDDNELIDAIYYITKVTEKLYFKKEIEKL